MTRLLVALIRFYQKHISAHTPGHCRFIPTCSNYAIQALQTHGVIKGLLLTLWRILRCNPFGKFGFDPVPEIWDLNYYKKNKKKTDQPPTPGGE